MWRFVAKLVVPGAVVETPGTTDLKTRPHFPYGVDNFYPNTECFKRKVTNLHVCNKVTGEPTICTALQINRKSCINSRYVLRHRRLNGRFVAHVLKWLK
jgi:hypothetical protein